MAFTVTILDRSVAGNKRVVTGLCVNDGGSTGGEITTGLNRVDHIQLQGKGSAVQSNAAVVDETFPLASGDVTVVTDADKSFYFRAEGV